MDTSTEIQIKKVIALCGPLFVVTYLVFWGILGHNIAPPRMIGVTGADFVSSYYGRYSDITIGMIGSCVAGLLYLPWSCLLATTLRDSDGRLGVLAMMELGGGILTGWVLAFCPALWAACSLMVGKVDPEVIRAMHLSAWVVYDCTFMITTVQLTGLGLYVVFNRAQKIFPEWTGWAAIGTGAVFLPLVLVPFVGEGPFAVNGVWNFYIVFGVWLFGFFTPFSYYMIRSFNSEAVERSEIGRRPAVSA